MTPEQLAALLAHDLAELEPDEQQAAAALLQLDDPERVLELLRLIADMHPGLRRAVSDVLAAPTAPENA